MAVSILVVYPSGTIFYIANVYGNNIRKITLNSKIVSTYEGVGCPVTYYYRASYNTSSTGGRILVTTSNVISVPLIDGSLITSTFNLYVSDYDCSVIRKIAVLFVGASFNNSSGITISNFYVYDLIA
jgi:hypothetical protein